MYDSNISFFNDVNVPDVIELRNICQSYDGGKTFIIKDLNLLIEDNTSNGKFIVVLGTSGCVDADTEFFSGKKWKRIADWNNDEVLQYRSDGVAELVYPTRYTVLPAEDLNLIQSKYGFDQCFCDEHTVVFIDTRKGKHKNIRTITGKDLVKRQVSTDYGFQGKFITTFRYNGKGIPLSDAEIRVMVAVIADGYFRSSTRHCIIRIKKKRKLERIRTILKDAGIAFEEKKQPKGFLNFVFDAPRQEKYYTDFWYDCSQSQLKIVTQESLLWDGSTTNNRNYVSTAIKQTADFLQFASTACGIRSTINVTDRRNTHRGKYVRKSIEYKVLHSRNAFIGVSGKPSVRVKMYKTIDGKKYCFSVPSGMLVLRRNNKIFITGNCGKSTILRHITGIQKPTSGEVLINGKPRDDKTTIGMVFQQYSSFPWLSVLDNVALGLKFKGVSQKERRARAMEMIKLVGLEGQESKYAKYPTLSGGQLQRVAIARSLVSTPEILQMDEPFGALDVNTRLKMQELLCQIWTKLKATVIFVTHDIPEAVYLGDEIFIMRSSPGMIAEKITVDLPYERNASMKREKRFTDQVYNIEDKLRALQAHVDEEKIQVKS